MDRFLSTFKKEVEDFSFTAARKNRSIFSLSSKQVGILSGKEKHSSWFFFSDASKVEVVHRRL